MRVSVVGSGSSGNLALVEADGTRLVVDAGIGPRRTTARLRELGVDLFSAPVDGIVVTHEHGDHAAHAVPLARALRCPVYLHPDIAAPELRRRFEVWAYDPGGAFVIGALRVETLALPHDATQVALRVAGSRAAFGIATDLGHAPAGLATLLGACDAAILESNHCPRLLREGPYPARLKARVAGDRGHLSNEQAADLVRRLPRGRLRRLWLGHVSRTNNTPRAAFAAVAPHGAGLELGVLGHGEHALLDVVPAPSGEQLSLGL